MMEYDPKTCPRCGGQALREIDCGPDSYEDDKSWNALICEGCGLYWSGWTETWMIDCENWTDEDDAKEYHATD